MRLSSWLAVLMVGGVAVSGCDTAPGPPRLGLRPPSLSDFTFSPQEVFFNALPPEQIAGDQVLIPLALSVVAQDPDGVVDAVRFIVQGPTGTGEPLAEGSLDPADGDLYTTMQTVSIPALDEATYTVVVFAIDDDQQASGEARGLLRYSREFEPSAPPVLVEVTAPERVQRPAQGDPAVSFLLIAQAEDPDGLTDIARVEFWNVDTPTTRFLMCDDGGGLVCGQASDSGDAVPGDGRFTLRIFLESTNSAGTRTFVFEATDRAGLTSEQIEKQIIVD